MLVSIAYYLLQAVFTPFYLFLHSQQLRDAPLVHCIEVCDFDSQRLTDRQLARLQANVSYPPIHL